MKEMGALPPPNAPATVYFKKMPIPDSCHLLADKKKWRKSVE